jgi:hypothetical protein
MVLVSHHGIKNAPDESYATLAAALGSDAEAFTGLKSTRKISWLSEK